MTRTIEYTQIVQAVRRACIEAAFELPHDVLDALRAARRTDSNERAGAADT
jgi:tartrate dehydratase alpha subunit/fumarate hydratase class I-like protein